MPEAPEVFCQAAALAHLLDVPLASSIDVAPSTAHLPVWRDTVFRDDFWWSHRHLNGERPDYVRHVGKVMRLEFKGIPEALQFRFGMTGRLSLSLLDVGRARMTFTFHNGEGHFLYYVDPRGFGSVSVVDRREPLITGVDAYTLRPTQLQEICAKSKRKIRDLLTDQKVVAGIGNYLVNEVLWMAQIHPYRCANTLDKVAVWNLTALIQVTIAASVTRGGATLSTYFGLDGRRGEFSDKFQAYQRKKCSRCGNAITRLHSTGTQSSYVCLECQK